MASSRPAAAAAACLVLLMLHLLGAASAFPHHTRGAAKTRARVGAPAPAPTSIHSSSGNPLLGINYGRVADNLPSPSEAVALIQRLGFGNVRIFDADAQVLAALANTGINVVITVKNQDIPTIASSKAAANSWVQQNVATFFPATHIAFINVGNEILSGSDPTPLWTQLVPAMENIYAALLQHGLAGVVKVTTSSAMDVLALSYPPSSGTFRRDIATSVITPLLDFLTKTSSPFFLNVYPYFAWVSNMRNIPLSYALFNASTAPTVTDGKLNYYTVLDAQLDAVAAAMAKLGFPNVNIVISETGWPTIGDIDQPDAVSPATARIYNQGLVDKVLGNAPLNINNGTPLRPNASVPTYIFALFNEDLKPGPITERNWGLFYPNGTQVYPFHIAGAARTGSAPTASPPTRPTPSSSRSSAPSPLSFQPPANSPASSTSSPASGNPLLGINYGRVADNLPSPVETVALIRRLGFGSVRIFDTDAQVLAALANTGLNVVITVKNQDIPSIASSKAAANNWVQQNVAAFFPATHIGFINVGNEILSGSDPIPLWTQLVPAMENIYTALLQHGLAGVVKVTTSSAMDVLALSYPPSSGTFRRDIATSAITPLLDFLTRTSSPFFLNVYPYFAWLSNMRNIPLSYALFNASTAPTIIDGGLHYYSLLDAQLDAVAAAMAKLGFPKVDIVISETGWPTMGDIDQPAGAVSPATAHVYNQGLVDKVLGNAPLNINKGTPMRPSASVPTYIFALFNEDLKPGPITERNWGLFYPNGIQVYPFHITGPARTGSVPGAAPTASPRPAPTPSSSPSTSSTPSSTSPAHSPSPTTSLGTPFLGPSPNSPESGSRRHLQIA